MEDLQFKIVEINRYMAKLSVNSIQLEDVNQYSPNIVRKILESSQSFIGYINMNELNNNQIICLVYNLLIVFYDYVVDLKVADFYLNDLYFLKKRIKVILLLVKLFCWVQSKQIQAFIQYVPSKYKVENLKEYLLNENMFITAQKIKSSQNDQLAALVNNQQPENLSAALLVELSKNTIKNTAKQTKLSLNELEIQKQSEIDLEQFRYKREQQLNVDSSFDMKLREAEEQLNQIQLQNKVKFNEIVGNVASNERKKLQWIDIDLE
ncbi:Hypothetical_protein [Hexamita inflata]|uniref:Hypothetical_protein n=1 Tax=Hexamita inflata TaxID=28002 RepID=A0AA86PEF3_9EUKA|nr:Hypothetical protein HINF_LOCUS21877 [Hexamita inflata]